MFTIPRIGDAGLSAEEVTDYMTPAGFTCVELVPSLLFGERWTIPKQGIPSNLARFTSIQSLTYGIPASLGTRRWTLEALALWEERLERLAELSAHAPSVTFVLGSPRQRIRDGQSVATAVGAFAERVVEILSATGPDSRLVVEPNPACQGAEFLTTVSDVMNFVDALRNPRLGVCLDVACIGHLEPIEWRDLRQRLVELDPPLHVQIDAESIALRSPTFHQVLVLASMSENTVGLALEDPAQLTVAEARAARVDIEFFTQSLRSSEG